jgi:hypothetical protein
MDWRSADAQKHVLPRRELDEPRRARYGQWKSGAIGHVSEMKMTTYLPALPRSSFVL